MTNQSNRTVIRRKLVRKQPLKEQPNPKINTNIKKIIRKKIIRKPQQIIETKPIQDQIEEVNETHNIKKRIIKKRIKKTKQEQPKQEQTKQEIKPEINTTIQISNKSFLNQIFDDLTDDESDDLENNENEPNKGNLSDDELEEVLVINWKCSHHGKDYLLDPITQEVFCKKTRDLIGVRYKNDDELSLIDFN